jgi:hypothetical protein
MQEQLPTTAGMYDYRSNQSQAMIPESGYVLVICRDFGCKNAMLSLGGLFQITIRRLGRG